MRSRNQINWFWLFPCFLRISITSLSTHETVFVNCVGWETSTCPLLTPPRRLSPIRTTTLQTLCKASLTIAADQIEWLGPHGGKGSISSVLVNDKEMLPSAFYPSDHMNPPNYPQCQLWTDAFSPYETVVPGVGGDKIDILDIAQRNYIETELTFAWMGPRPIVPNVCSMEGVSYAAAVRLDYYFEMQELSGTI